MCGFDEPELVRKTSSPALLISLPILDVASPVFKLPLLLSGHFLEVHISVVLLLECNSLFFLTSNVAKLGIVNIFPYRTGLLSVSVLLLLFLHSSLATFITSPRHQRLLEILSPLSYVPAVY